MNSMRRISKLVSMFFTRVIAMRLTLAGIPELDALALEEEDESVCAVFGFCLIDVVDGVL